MASFGSCDLAHRGAICRRSSAAIPLATIASFRCLVWGSGRCSGLPTLMQILSGVFALIGAAAALAALVTLFYALIYGYRYYAPRNPTNLVAVILRVYKRQITAFFVLYVVSIAAFVLAAIFK